MDMVQKGWHGRL